MKTLKSVIILFLFCAMPFVSKADKGGNGKGNEGNGNGNGGSESTPSTPVNTNMVVLAIAGGLLVTTVGYNYMKKNTNRSVAA